MWLLSLMADKSNNKYSRILGLGEPPPSEPIGALPTDKFLKELGRIESEINPSLTSYEPVTSDKIAYWLSDKLGGGRENTRFAKKLTDAGQFVSDFGTLPLYFTAAAPFAAAVDISRGIVEKDPIEMALGTIGIARPIKAVPQTMSDEAERALTAATGTAGIGMVLEDFFLSLFNKKEGNK